MRHSDYSFPRDSSQAADEAAMQSVVDGNQGAFQILIQRWQNPIQRLCFRLIGDWQAAEDLTQETFSRLYATRNHYRPNAKFSTYLWRIALNGCHDYRRRRQIPTATGGYIDDQESGTECDPATIVGKQDESYRVQRALNQLSEPYRNVLVLRHYEGLKIREVADVLQIPVGTVSSRTAEALKQLANQLIDDTQPVHRISQRPST